MLVFAIFFDIMRRTRRWRNLPAGRQVGRRTGLCSQHTRCAVKEQHIRRIDSELGTEGAAAQFGPKQDNQTV